MGYAAGYYTFLALSCVVILLVSILLRRSLYNRNHSTQENDDLVLYYSNRAFVCSLLAGGAAALVIWGSISLAWGRKGDIADFNESGPLAAVACGLILLFLSFSSVIICFFQGSRALDTDANRDTSDSFERERIIVLFVAAFLCLVPGMITLSIACNKIAIFETYENTTTQITDSWTSYETLFCPRNKGISTCEGIIGQLQLEWGQDWPCPGNSDELCPCSAWISETKCVEIMTQTYHSVGGSSMTSNYMSISEAKAKVESCLMATYGLPQTGELDISIIQNGSWPILNAFASRSCNAVLLEQKAAAQPTAAVGIAMSITGLFLLFICSRSRYSEIRRGLIERRQRRRLRHLAKTTRRQRQRDRQTAPRTVISVTDNDASTTTSNNDELILSPFNIQTVLPDNDSIALSADRNIDFK